MGNGSGIAIPRWGVQALRVLEDEGFEAWAVGGFVRDALRGESPHDLDIASSATWRQAAAAFRKAGFPVHETGTAFGTITAVVDGHPIEATTFRADGAYLDARHPESVAFVQSIDDDLARRDFTVNAMAYHPARGLRDPFGGMDDLAQGTIRCVGDAGERFAEDALRILRGIRFSSQLGFGIAQPTLSAMRANAGRLQSIAVERVFSELDRMLAGPGAGKAILTCPDVLAAVLPCIGEMDGCPQNTPYHAYDVLGHTARVVDGSPSTSLSRWAALFHDTGKPRCRRVDEAGRDHFLGHAAIGAQVAWEELGRLKAPAKLREDVRTLVALHEWFVPDTDAAVRRALRKLDGRADLYRRLLDLQVADAGAKAPGVTERLEAAQRTRMRLEKVLERGDAFTVAQLAIGGGDLIQAGWSPGPEIGAELSALLDAVVDGALENDRDTLLAHARMHRGV